MVSTGHCAINVISAPHNDTSRVVQSPPGQRMSRNFQDDEDIGTREEDEFFDAIDANAIPNLLVS